MARTAPDTFAGIADASLYPLEPILSGAGGAAEWQAAILNSNHVYRWLNPMVVRQDEVSATAHYVSNLQNSTPTAYEFVHAWRIPVYPGLAGQTLGGCVFGRCPSGTGKVRIGTLGTPDTDELAFTSATTERVSFTGLTVDTTGTYDTVTLEIKGDAGGNELRIINVDLWLEEAATPLAAGDDGNGVFPQDDSDGAADKPLPIYRVRRIAQNLEIVAERPGVVMSFADDLRGARSNFNTTSKARSIEKIPVRYGPKATALRVYANGYCNDTAKRLRIWTDQDGYDAATEIQLPTNGAWSAAKTTSWVTASLSVFETTTSETTLFHAEIEGSGGNEANLYSLCVFEE
jgi:hypothetical protein